jgi:hypothetical protein
LVFRSFELFHFSLPVERSATRGFAATKLHRYD